MADKMTKKERLRLVKVQTTVYLDPSQADALRDLAKNTRRTQQSLLREAVDYILQLHGAPLGR